MTLNAPPYPTGFYALNNQSGTPQLKIYAPERNSVGSTFASAETFTAGDQSSCRVILFGTTINSGVEGSNGILIAMQRSGIYRSTDQGSNWTLVHTLTDVDATACKSGLYIVYINGVATLCGFYRAVTGSAFRGVTSTDGTTWTNTILPGATASGTTTPYGMTLYRGKLFGIQGTQVFIYDPGAGTIASIDVSEVPSASSLSSAGLTVCGGNVYIAYRDSSGFLSLAKLGGGSFSQKFTSTSSVSTGTGKWGVWTLTASAGGTPDPFIPATLQEQVCVIAHRPGAGTLSPFDPRWGSYFFLYQPSTDTFTFTDLTATSIPSLMATASGTTTSVAIFFDTAVNPGAVRDVFIYYNDGTANWNLYRWNNYQRMGKWAPPTTNIPLVAAFADTDDALPSLPQVTGSYTFGAGAIAFGGNTYYQFSSSQVSVNLISRAYVTGGIRLTFTLAFPQFAGQLAKIVGFWGTKNTTLPNNSVATLTASSHGTITGNIIYNLVPDGVTQFQVTWLAETDGISNFDSYKIVLVAFPQ